ncbi:MAG: hypothetical protein CMH50_08935 [Myxococcales bacterium]|nr:hypothetical protein [Myxococcales bacterium]
MIPQTAATPVADYLDGLGGQITAALVIALRGEELRVVGRRGSFGELSLGSLSEQRLLVDTLNSGAPWIGDQSEALHQFRTQMGRDHDAGLAILWPLIQGDKHFGVVYLEPQQKEVDAQLLGHLSLHGGRLIQRLHARLTGFKPSPSRSSVGLRRSTGLYPVDSERVICGRGEVVPLQAGEVSDARLMLNLALAHPGGAAAQQLHRLDPYLTAPLLARFLDTELGDLLPILESLPLSRRRAIRILVTSEQGALRQEALHCLERWPDPELCSAASADMPETSLARELLPLAFSTDRSLATSVARVLERARRHPDFDREVLSSLRDLFGQSMHAGGRSSLKPCRGGGQHMMTFLADHRSDDGSIMMTFQCRVCQASVRFPTREAEYHRLSEQLGRAMELLARFRDPRAVGDMIPYLDHHALKDRARRALVDLTLVGRDWRRHQWERWWRHHQNRGRQAWILDGLGHWDSEVRSRAVAELYAETGDNFGFRPEGKRAERKEAIGRVRASLLPQQAVVDAEPVI